MKALVTEVSAPEALPVEAEVPLPDIVIEEITEPLRENVIETTGVTEEPVSEVPNTQPDRPVTPP